VPVLLVALVVLCVLERDPTPHFLSGSLIGPDYTDRQLARTERAAYGGYRRGSPEQSRKRGGTVRRGRFSLLRRPRIRSVAESDELRSKIKRRAGIAYILVGIALCS
jgi:hypothetical protein